LAGCRGEPFVQSPLALLRERSVEPLALLGARSVDLLALLCECSAVFLWVALICCSMLALVERKPLICATTVPITVSACNDHRDGLSVHKRNLARSRSVVWTRRSFFRAVGSLARTSEARQRTGKTVAIPRCWKWTLRRLTPSVQPADIDRRRERGPERGDGQPPGRGPGPLVHVDTMNVRKPEDIAPTASKLSFKITASSHGLVP
jgi:hypothetical protein